MSIHVAPAKLAHYPIEKLKKDINKIVGKHLDLSKYQLFIFGSRINGKSTDHSDIDVGIEGPEPIPMKALADIKEAVENLPTLYSIEIVDFKKVTSKFRDVAKKHIETIF